MAGKGGLSGSGYERKRTSKAYEDRQGHWRPRRDDGTFGHQVSDKKMSGKGFVAHEFKIWIGRYEFGKAKIELNKSGFSFSAETTGPKATYEINRNLSELAKDANFDPVIINSLHDTLYKSRLNLDINAVKLKNIEIESPNVSIGATVKTDQIGAKGSAQLTALKINLETPFGEISAKLKAGFNIGSELGLSQTRSGKIGISRADSISFGLWEFSLTPEQQKEQAPSIFDWQEYKRSSDPFSSTPHDPRQLFQNAQLSSKFDFDKLFILKSTENTTKNEDPSDADIEWDDNLPDNKESQKDFFSEILLDDNTPTFKNIRANANLEDARSVFKTNIENFYLNDEGLNSIDQLTLEELKKANLMLHATYQAQLAIIKKIQVDTQDQANALNNLNQGANGFIKFGEQFQSSALVTIGKVLQITVLIFQVINSCQNAPKDQNALSNLFAPLGALAALGPYGMMLGAFVSILNILSSSSGPSISEITLDKINQLLEGQEKILNSLSTIRQEQAQLLHTLQQDIAHLQYELAQRMSCVRIDFNDALDRIENSLSYISSLTRITARNQYLQNFKHHCKQTKTISLKNGREAHQITVGLSTVLLNDANNEILSGLTERRAGLPPNEQLRLIYGLFANEVDDTIDQHLNFLLGYFYGQEMINPFIWQQAAQQYILHTQSFFALYMEDSDKDLYQAIHLGEQFEELLENLTAESQLQIAIDSYYKALDEINTQQQQMLNQFNLSRKMQYHYDYTHEGFGNNGIENLNFFNPVQQLLDEFQKFDDDTKKYMHSFQHLKATSIGQKPNTLQVNLTPYAGRASSEPKTPYWDLSLSMLSDKLKEIQRTDLNLMKIMGYLLCCEYLKIISLFAHSHNMSYPDIPFSKSKHDPHAREIVQNTRKVPPQGSPGRYFLSNDHAPWDFTIDINLMEFKTILILLPVLPQVDKIDAILKNAESAYVLSNYENHERAYFLHKHRKQMIQIFELPQSFITKLRNNTATGANRRELYTDEQEVLARYYKQKSTLSLKVSGHYTNFDASISGIDEDDDGYKEANPPHDDFHKNVRAAIPHYIEQNWRTSHAMELTADLDLDLIQNKIEQKYIEERKAFFIYLISKKADHAQFQQSILDYHAALLALDIKYYELKAQLHLAGKELPDGLLCSHDILREIEANHANIAMADITPNLTKAVEEKDKPTAKKLTDKKFLGAFHPKRLLQGTISQLSAHQYWRKWMRRNYPWLKYKDLHQYWTQSIFNNIEKIRDEIFAYYKDIKLDVSGFNYAVSRLNYADSAPITTASMYQNVYSALHDWTLLHARNSNLTGYRLDLKNVKSLEAALDFSKLKRGWSENIGFLIQYAARFLGIQINASNLCNFTYWLDGSVYFCKLLDDKTGPYKNTEAFSEGCGITRENKESAIEKMLESGYMLHNAITAVAFCDKLFEFLIEEYLKSFNALLIIVKQAKSKTDFEIIESLMPDNFAQQRINAGTFLEIKNNLNNNATLIENYLSLAFEQDFNALFKQTIIYGEDLESTLRQLMTKQEAKQEGHALLEKSIETRIKKVIFYKKELLQTICLNRSLCYFALKLEHYFDNEANAGMDTLYITQDFILKGTDMQNSIVFEESHLDLIDQFLEQNPSIKAISFYEITFNKNLLTQIVLLLKNKYNAITRLTLSAANISPDYLSCLNPLLQQLVHLDLRGNLLGSEVDNIDSLRFIHIVPFIEQCRQNIQYLGIANNDLSILDIAAIQAVFVFSPDDVKDKAFTIDITDNPGKNEFDNTLAMSVINTQDASAEKMKPKAVTNPQTGTLLDPDYICFGQKHLGMTLNLLKQTKQLLQKYQVEPRLSFSFKK